MRKRRGRNYTVPALDVDIEEAKATFQTNFFAIVSINQTFIPLLLPTRGLILNIGSVAGIMPYTFGSIYNASKAALHSYSSTLRVELEPYGVRVLVVITGGVQSNITRTYRDLPAGSLYLDVEQDYIRRQKHSQEGAMSNEVYARGVVKEALKTKPKKWLWRGNKSFVVWLVSRVFGAWLFDVVLPRMFGLDRLKRIVEARKKTV